MTKILINLALLFARFVNVFFRPLKLKEKVTIISRQSDKPTLDIELLTACLDKENIETAVLTKTLRKSIGGMISYCFHLLSQMYNIATSKVVVIDGYCILVSILPKKKGQSVVQMWHALGAVKKFGWQSVENPDGSSREVAEAMCMHRNYDYVLAPCRITGSFFAEAFRTDEDKLVMLGLPRIDFIRAENNDLKTEIENKYPKIREKVNVLYVPTFRKNAVLGMDKLISGFDFNSFNLIIKKHFLDKGDYSWAEEAGAIVDTEYSSLEWLRICDKIVTDYSAIAFEAAILDKELYIYQPDADAYEHNVGLNVDMEKESVSKYMCRSEEEFFECLKKPYINEDVVDFKNKYFEINMDDCTQQLCDFIGGLLKK